MAMQSPSAKMPARHKAIFGVVFVVSFAINATTLAADSTRHNDEREAAEWGLARIKAAVQKEDVAIFFYGQVVDQTRDAVEGASVEIHIACFSPDEEFFVAIKTIVVKTDSKGFFAIEGGKGNSLDINSISRSGYECPLLKDQERSFRYAGEGVDKLFVADKKKPVIFQIRKQSRTTFLLKNLYWEFSISPRESGQNKGYDFIQEIAIRNMHILVQNDQPLVPDIQIKATFNTNATWAVVLSSGITNGGIIVSDQLLYEAPETGYEPQFTFTIAGRKQMKAKYIYLRSRTPAIYTRIELDDYLEGNKDGFSLNGSLYGRAVVTNPYGERNLEEAKDLPYEITKQLTDEARAAFRQNKRPAKPDLSKLLKDASIKAAKDK